MPILNFEFKVVMYKDISTNPMVDHDLPEVCDDDFVIKHIDDVIKWYKEQMDIIAELNSSRIISIKYKEDSTLLVEIDIDESIFEDDTNDEKDSFIESLIEQLIDPDDDRNCDLKLDDGFNYFFCGSEYDLV